MITQSEMNKISNVVEYHRRFDVNETICIFFTLAILCVVNISLVTSWGDVVCWFWHWQREADLTGILGVFFGLHGEYLATSALIFVFYIFIHTQLPYLNCQLRRRSRIGSSGRSLYTRFSKILKLPSRTNGRDKIRMKGRIVIVVAFLMAVPPSVYMLSMGSYWPTMVVSILYIPIISIILFVIFIFPISVFSSLSRKSNMYVRSVITGRLLSVYIALKRQSDLYIVGQGIQKSVESLSSFRKRLDVHTEPLWVRQKFLGHENYLRELMGWCSVPGVRTRNDLEMEIENAIKSWATGDLVSLKSSEVIETNKKEHRLALLTIGFVPLLAFALCKWMIGSKLDSSDYFLFCLLYFMLIYWVVGGTLNGLKTALEDNIGSAFKKALGG